MRGKAKSKMPLAVILVKHAMCADSVFFDYKFPSESQCREGILPAKVWFATTLSVQNTRVLEKHGEAALPLSFTKPIIPGRRPRLSERRTEGRIPGVGVP